MPSWWRVMSVWMCSVCRSHPLRTLPVEEKRTGDRRVRHARSIGAVERGLADFIRAAIRSVVAAVSPTVVEPVAMSSVAGAAPKPLDELVAGAVDAVRGRPFVADSKGDA